MRQVSSAFHAAVRDGSPQRSLLRFADGTILTGEDLESLRCIEAVQEAEDITVGECVSGELRCTVFNEHGLLSSFAYGEADTYLGVRTGTESARSAGESARIVIGSGSGVNVLGAYGSAPYLRIGCHYNWKRYSVSEVVTGYTTVKIDERQQALLPAWYRARQEYAVAHLGGVYVYDWSGGTATKRVSAGQWVMADENGPIAGWRDPPEETTSEYAAQILADYRLALYHIEQVTERRRGDYIDDVIAVDDGAYPADGEQGGYWYVRQESSAVATTGQPGFAPVSLVMDGTALYATSASGAVWKGAVAGGDVTEAAVQPTVSPFMAAKLSGWAGRGLYLNGLSLTEVSGGSMSTWEYCPLGLYSLTTPTRRSIRVELEGQDRMQRFDRDVSSWWSGLTWPKTLSQLLSSLCDYCGVSWTAVSFPNSELSIASAPMGATGMIGRDMLAWICEAGCSYGHIGRTGSLELKWWGASVQTVPGTGQTALETAEYTAPAIDHVHIMVAKNDLGVLVPESGTVVNEYQIIDNPFLYGTTEAAVRALGLPIYNRLAAMSAYTPLTLSCVCDWSIEAGDMITVTVGSTTVTVPLMHQEIEYTGGASVRYEVTGNPSRLIANSAIREYYEKSWQYYKLEADIEGLRSEVGGIEGQVSTITQTMSGIQTQVTGLSSELITQASAWAANTRYSVGAVCYLGSGSNRTYYKCTTAHTSGASFDASKWSQTQDTSYSRFTQSSDQILMEISGGYYEKQTSVAINANGVAISSNGKLQVDMTNFSIDAGGNVAITGSINATSGTIGGCTIDEDGNLQVANANIGTLYAGKIVGGSVYGYIPAAAISDKSHSVSMLYVGKIYSDEGMLAPNTYGSTTYADTLISGTGITFKGTYYGWAGIVSGGGSAKWG